MCLGKYCVIRILKTILSYIIFNYKITIRKIIESPQITKLLDTNGLKEVFC